jgi:hypothetical protein
MTVSAFRPKRDDHLRPVASKLADDVAQEPPANSLDFFDSFERTIRVIEDLQEADPELGSGVAKLKSPNVGQRAEIAGGSTIPEPGTATRHGDQADGRALGTVARDRRRAAEALVVGMRHHHQQPLAVTLHAPTIMNVS